MNDNAINENPQPHAEAPKKRKFSNLFFIIIIIMLAVSVLAIFKIDFLNSISSTKKPPQAACKLGGGEWIEFTSTITDDCAYQNANTGFWAMTWGCECGTRKCWSGSKCIRNP